MNEYTHSLKIRDKEIKFRKWKVKDKKKFIEALNNDDVKASEDIVFDCIENKSVILTDTEYKYVLMNIRSASIGESLTFKINCDHCEEDFDYETKILEIRKPSYKDFGVIKSGNTSIKIGEIQNKEYYEDAIRQCTTQEEKSFIDFLYHVKELNGEDTFTFDFLYDFINNIDIQTGEELFTQWEDMKFTFDDINDVECTECGKFQRIKFDELYGFFPESWFE